MTLPRLLVILKERSLRIVFDDDGNPSLKGDKGEVTDCLIKIVKRLRTEIIEQLGPNGHGMEYTT